MLGGLADLAGEYATKRYRSNLINWGILPLITAESLEDIRVGDYLLVPGIRRALKEGRSDLRVRRVTGVQREISCTLGPVSYTHLLISRRKEIVFRPGEKPMVWGRRFSAVVLNPGVILYLLLCAGLFRMSSLV